MTWMECIRLCWMHRSESTRWRLKNSSWLLWFRRIFTSLKSLGSLNSWNSSKNISLETSLKFRFIGSSVLSLEVSRIKKIPPTNLKSLRVHAIIKISVKFHLKIASKLIKNLLLCPIAANHEEFSRARALEKFKLFRAICKTLWRSLRN